LDAVDTIADWKLSNAAVLRETTITSTIPTVPVQEDLGVSILLSVIFRSRTFRTRWIVLHSPKPKNYEVEDKSPRS